MKKNNKRGFTLIELAVVIVIIGLIITAVVKGQQMVEDSRVRAVADQINGFKSAITTFQDKYGALPGDFTQATTRLPGCEDASNNCQNGDGDGFVGEPRSSSASVIGTESRMAWQHLAFANLISGVTAGANADEFVVGQNFPAARTGGGFVLLNTTLNNPVRSGLWLRLANISATSSGLTTSGTGALTPGQAAEIDRRLDDGRSNSGTIRGDGVTETCRPDSGIYDERITSRDCNLFILVQ